jgi:S1-C subfamily serine protease
MLKLLGMSATLALTLTTGAIIGGKSMVAAAQQPVTPGPVVAPTATPIPTEPGVVISSVEAGGPAATAGVKRGDILLSVNNQPVNSPAELVQLMSTLTAGSQAQLTVLHGDAQRNLTATLGDKNGKAYLGVIPCGGGFSGPDNHYPRPMPPFTAGAMVIEVAPNSPAAQAGIQPGEIITEVDGQPLGDQNLSEIIAAKTPGVTIYLTLQQPGQQARQVAVTLADNPNNPGAAYLGIRYQPHGPKDFGPGWDMPFGPNFPIPGGEGNVNIQGLIIKDVQSSSPAAQAGLTRGDVITAINGQPVTSPGDLQEAVSASQIGATITLTLTDESGATRTLIVTLAENPNQAGAPYMGVTSGGYFHMRGSGDDNSFEKHFEWFNDNFNEPGRGFPGFQFRPPPMPHFDAPGQQSCPGCSNSI